MGAIRVHWAVAAPVLVAVLAAGIGAVSAATLGGVSGGSIAASTQAASTGAATVIAWENFDGTNGASISGTTTDGGGLTWTQFGGTWTVSSNQAKSTSAAPSGLQINAGTANCSVEATVNLGGGTPDAELIINSSNTGADHLLASWTKGSGGTLTLWKRVSGTYTSLASVTGVGTATSTLRIESPASSVVKVYKGGVQQLSYTLTAGEQSTFKNASHQYAGLVSYNDASSTYDNFHVDS